MNWEKYRFAIIYYILFNVFFIIFGLIAMVLLNQLKFLYSMTPLIPVTNMAIEMIIILLVIIPISAILGSFGGYISAPIILFFHKKILGRKYDYSIQEKPISNEFQNKTRGFFPVLMAMNFGFLLSIPQVKAFILSPVWLSSSDPMLTLTSGLISMLVLLMFTYGLSIFIFSGTWFLLDSGLVYSTKRAVENKLEPDEILSVGGWLNRLLKGYAGFTVLFTYFLLIYNFLIAISSMGVIGIVNLIFYLPLPFFLTLPAIPGLIISEIIVEKRNKFVRKIAEKQGIHVKKE